MNKYKTDRWCIVKIEPQGVLPMYRLFVSYYGGYTYGETWRMNSGISFVEAFDNFYDVHSASGSIYTCYKNAYGWTTYGQSVLLNIQEDLKEKFNSDLTIYDNIGSIQSYLNAFGD